MPVTIKRSTLFLYIGALYLMFVDAVEPGLKSIDVDNNVTNNNVIETQYATCKIATEELVANARATVTKVLTGACNAKTIDERFQNLEKNLSEELLEIKTLLHLLLEQRNTLSTIDASTVQRKDKFRNIKSDYKLSYNNNNVPPRQDEINEFNNTIKTESSNGSSSVFTYYWEVKHFHEKLSTWSRTRSERSSTFYVSQPGYAMYLKIAPKYFPDGTIFVSVGLTRGRYDSLVKWPFSHKIQLMILDQSSGGSREDRPSRIWDPTALCTEYFWGRPKPTGEPDNPECVGLSISRNIILSKLPSVFRYDAKNSRYIWNDTVLVKLLIYF
ncbi:hypothetical protein KPH14_012092 [Odynerus spinipes]|uniref:TRAF1-6 MATH domain-containing protein n=1 Tax=Odynerus spinipes TaxID=1348599 RepID=A0AAD9VJ92_9HYME|nr:hypothetical protein KPH14_012092 [Odynerus spinipes]